MIIANIVSKDKMDLGPEFKIFESVEDIADANLPTLIIGCDYCRTIYGQDLDFNNREVAPNVFWTFNKKELRKNYHNDLEDFIQYAYEFSVSKLHYIHLDLIQYSDSKLKKIIRKMLTISDFHSFKYENIIYMYSENCIFAVDLELVRFVGLDVIRVERKIKSRSVVFLEGFEILIEYKNYMERLDNKAKYIPFIYFISNHE